ncbi:uncharacterized protein LOC134789576 [Cydia splendana]|uniref:uncharacterized protein LOC134789576 n=1 Tax=Cydia splendana TaxID=1100963 RepID=UPI00300CB734
MHYIFKDNPLEAQRLVVQCYINLQTYHLSMKAMLNVDFVQDMINILQRIDISLKKMACNVLTGLMAEPVAKDLFTLCKGEEVVSTNLHIKHVGFNTALCTLITASVTDEGADVYLRLGTVHFMVENRLARYVVSAWEPALEAIFRHHPSAKLAYTGRLDLNDFTREGFYVQKRLSTPFPTIQQLMDEPPPHEDPVFISLFQPPVSESGVVSGIDFGHQCKCKLERAATGVVDLSLHRIIAAMLGSERKWEAVASFCEEVMSQKEEAEREREAAADAVPLRRRRQGRRRRAYARLEP